nr:cilia- and flagella-associated protein 251-like isoform X1 [Oncorhynchus nerka]
MKEEEEEEAVTIQKQLEGEAVTVKEEEKDAFRVKEEEDVTVKEVEYSVFGVEDEVKEEEDVLGMKDEEGEITVTLEEDEEEKTGELINTNKELYESQYMYEEVPMKSSGPQSWGLKEAHFCFYLHTAQLIQMINSSSRFKWYFCIHL